ncbi:MAG: ABC transporter permease [Cyclobacteriaceae bacterium]
MLRSYLKIAYRNLLKNKVFSLINIFGLAIGMAACLLILQYVSFELSYDDFRRPDIYRIVQLNYMNGEAVGQRAQNVPALGPALQNDVPEVVRAARIVHTAPLMSDPVMQVGDRSFHEEKIYYADSSFLTMFSYQMIQGDADQALTQPGSMVISESMARKYFPDQEAVGQLLTFHRGERGPTPVRVTGVFADVPKNSHLHTDFLVSFSSFSGWNLDENWGWGNFYNYAEVLPGTDPITVREKFAAVVEKYQGEEMAEWRKGGYVRELGLQSIQDIHLDSDLVAEAETNGSRRTVEFLTLIAFFILMIAWINYLNLTTAKSVERAKEIGIRKVIGSDRKQLMGQILSESLVINLLAAILALTLSQLLMPSFRTLTQGNFTTSFNTEVGIATVGLFVVGTLLSGLYPAFVLSSFRPLSVLKGSIKSSKQGVLLRRGLVVFQFAASIALIAGTFAVRQQLNFMRQQDLGLNMEQTLVVKGPGMRDSTYQQHLTYFKNEASKLPVVQEVAVSSSVPGRELSWGREFHRPTQPENIAGIHIVAVDEEFFDLYEATFLSGRNFSRAVSSDRAAVIFNETAIRQLGFASAEEAVQQPVIWQESDNDQHTKTIVGVIKDFNQESLHQEVGPMVFALKRYLNAPWAGEYYSLKISTQDYPEALAQIRDNWAQAFPSSPFDYFFLDDYFNHQYQADQQFGRIFSLFAGLAILIACLGLFGLASYVTLQRTREIGIRKVLGASTQSVITLLSRDFLRLVIVASMIIVPIIYFAAKSWLESYAYRMDIHWWILALPVVVVWLLAMVTISFQTIKTALANPVDSLRYE